MKKECGLDEIEQNESMGRKHKMVCKTPNYIGHFLISVSAINGCISISSFASFLGIASSAIGLEICVIASGIKKYKSIIRKTKNKHNSVVSKI